MLDEQGAIDPRESFTAAVQAELDGFTFLGNGRCEIKSKEGERAGPNFVIAP